MPRLPFLPHLVLDEDVEDLEPDVGTTNMSTATMFRAWFLRKVTQV
jgi:hypothetical protein